MTVSIQPIDAEIRRLEKELARAKKAVADLILEERTLNSVAPAEEALARRFGLGAGR